MAHSRVLRSGNRRLSRQEAYRPGTSSARNGLMASDHPFPIQTGWKRGDPLEELLEREWLVTNGLGGYASGTIGGACTRRFHGKLIASLPSPFGRFMMLNHLEEWVVEGEDLTLEEFALECGVPVWRYSAGGARFEQRGGNPDRK